MSAAVKGNGLLKSRDKCASFWIAYSWISVLWSRNAFRNAIGQRRSRH